MSSNSLNLKKDLLQNPIVIVWLLLILATALSWFLGTDHSLFWIDSNLSTAIALIGISFFKIHLIDRYFMDIRYAPVKLKRIFDAWVLLTSLAIILFYIFS